MDRSQGQQILINLDDINLDDLRRTIEATVNNAVNSAISRAQKGTSSNSGSPEPPGLSEEPDVAIMSHSPSNPPPFIVRDIGYFDPDSGKGLVETKETNQVHQNVFSFTNRLKTRAVTTDTAVLRAHLPSCFIGKAEQ